MKRLTVAFFAFVLFARSVHAEQPNPILDMSGVKGGLIVHGCPFIALKDGSILCMGRDTR